MSRCNYPSRKETNVTLYADRGRLKLNFVHNGKRVRKALKLDDTPQNRKIAEDEIIPVIRTKLLRGEYGIKSKSKNFEYYANHFLKQKEKLESYEHKYYIYNKIIKFFGKRTVESITRFEIKEFLASLNIKPVSQKEYLSPIREILELAIDDREITSNEAIGIKLEKSDQVKIDYFSKDEIANILNTATDWFRVYLTIAFTTGMRHEEILGLKHTDIKDGFISIKRVKVENTIKDKTKTVNGMRTIPFNVDVSSLSESFYLFPNIRDVKSLRKRWTTLLKNAKVRYRPIKNTRHTFATQMLRSNIVTINELSGLLGHAKASTTLSFYASVIDSFDLDLKERLKRHDFVTIPQTDENIKVL